MGVVRRVVPPTEVIRPQGGGRRRAGDREALAAIIFVATSGCATDADRTTGMRKPPPLPTETGWETPAYAPAAAVRQVYISSLSQPPASAKLTTAALELVSQSGASVVNAELTPSYGSSSEH